jgi:galactitol-specific phosphotransferase system IIB component
MRQAAAAALIMSLAITAAQADVYRSVDAQGQVHYTDTPTPGSVLVHVQRGGGGLAQSSTPAAAATSSSTAAPAQTQTLAKANAQVQDALAKQATEKAVQQDVEQTRADQCTKAKSDYDLAIAARRIYKTGTDGERQYLSDDEAEQQRVNLHQAMQTACGS